MRKKKTTTTKKHPGFETEARAIARKEGIPIENARAIVASSSRHASKRAVQKNPRLKKVRKVRKKTTSSHAH